MSRILSYVVIAAIALGAGYYFALWRQPSEIYATPPAATSTPETVHLTTQTVSEETSAYIVDVQYPHFGIATIDTKIDARVNSAIAEFKTLPPNPPEMSSPQNELTIRFESPYIGDDIVSFKLIISEYTGGAHPNSIFSGLNFDRETGRQLLQSDAFKMIGRTAQQVSVSVTAQLKAKLGENMFEEGSNSNPENFSSFLISEDKVTFIFQPYQVAAYAAGPQEVSFERQR
ncbi:hypothetical protein COU18_01995 [Candidatus Kaiserbacteria bacterium CG10_big_fil_rev_8_21_14_0_10_51_14]|uniref:DUF3298 domain-containing protein n=1 Tax=Candidatus Kaiserbacteria bacterium CG10_big_fil_rev_8_21_14_0_10_51_14 TaxID=1974610 RepID=A0A2H0UBV8_9BACT|nr:MAG: hypothetical protein COU18_01995 [Candidatus Kaiserbacteria bacterium CG10_big_fil_rev_8_21_14_0_10_51_14]